ncbi:PTS sugar transporter subunit IIB [Thermoanaerobacterium thermosaccharolyticum]|uniref:PTS sugar transporter subunit IIB n=1 Tax=Thermoanaerobacterium thermosaccharolyticum TaxID=1517 RepID=UPI003D7AA53E
MKNKSYKINVGNTAHKEGATQIKKSVNVTKEDVENFKMLNSMGVKLTARMIPDESENNFMDFIKSL